MRTLPFRPRPWLLLCALLACREPTVYVPADAGASPPEFITETFDQLYPLFLLRKMAPGPKAALWRQYHGKWVRWTGLLVSLTPNGATFRQIPQTVTFDSSLFVEPASRARLQRFHPGQRVTYVGRLDAYDDIFRTFYLVHGDVVGAVETDAGAPPTAAPER